MGAAAAGLAGTAGVDVDCAKAPIAKVSELAATTALNRNLTGSFQWMRLTLSALI